jgi:hypothetical protein
MVNGNYVRFAAWQLPASFVGLGTIAHVLNGSRFFGPSSGAFSLAASGLSVDQVRLVADPLDPTHLARPLADFAVLSQGLVAAI